MEFLGKFKGGYEELWKAIIRPNRDQYTVKDLGPAEFRLKGKHYKRTDIKIKNKRGLDLECSHFEPVDPVAPQLPCVIYLHGNCSSRIEALQAVDVLLPSNISLFCFDFAGCGLSEGEYISLGWYERDDVDAVIEYLRKTGKVSTVGLWGRSMGAVTSLMHADRDPTIGGIVLDSPFSDLKILAEELVKSYANLPKLIVNGAMSLIRKTIQSKANFDINDLVPMNHVANGFVPAMFVAAKGDTFIDQHHTRDLYNKYSGDKNLVIVEGDHNSSRPQFLMDSISIFFHNTLLVDQIQKEEEKSYESKKKQINKQKEEKDKVPSFKEVKKARPKKIGNEDDIKNFLDDAEDEDFRRAIEESLKFIGEVNTHLNNNDAGALKGGEEEEEYIKFEDLEKFDELEKNEVKE